MTTPQESSWERPREHDSDAHEHAAGPCDPCGVRRVTQPAARRFGRRFGNRTVRRGHPTLRVITETPIRRPRYRSYGTYIVIIAFYRRYAELVRVSKRPKSFTRVAHTRAVQPTTGTKFAFGHTARASYGDGRVSSVR